MAICRTPPKTRHVHATVHCRGTEWALPRSVRVGVLSRFKRLVLCAITGFGGTPGQVASADGRSVLGPRRITVTFDGSLKDKLPWGIANRCNRDRRCASVETGLAF